MKSLYGDPNIRMHKVVALIKHRLALIPRQRIAEAVAEVEPRRMPAAFAIIAIGLPGNPCLFCGDWLDHDVCIFNQVVQLVR